MSDKTEIFESAYNTLMRPKSPWRKNPEQRADMTIANQDSKDMPRVKNAGQVISKDGQEVQVMHNGLLVKKDGYQGPWQTRTIEELKGTHEPQEEKVFSEILRRLGKNSTMMELGSWWSYYSLWFLKEIQDAKAVCCEPDPANIELGKANAKINGFSVGSEINFVFSAAGATDKKIVSFDALDGSKVRVPIRTVDSLIAEFKIKKLDILHMDIQGVELEALEGAKKSIDAGKIRYVFISTHHYSISHDPLMHTKCLEFIKKHGGTVIAKHTVLESSSGDGLIVASFDSKDRDFKVKITAQDFEDSLFRSSDEDIDVLWQAHDRMFKKLNDTQAKLEQSEARVRSLEGQLSELKALIESITPLSKHLKKQLRTRASKVKHKIKK